MLRARHILTILFLKNQVHIHQTPEILMPPGAYFIPKFTYAIGVKKKKKIFGVTQKIRQKSWKSEKNAHFQAYFWGGSDFRRMNIMRRLIVAQDP